MKKTLLLSLLIAFVAITNAQTVDKKWGIGAGIGAYGTLNKSGVGFMPELYLSRYLSPRLDLMLRGDLGLFNSKLTNDLDMANGFLDLRLKLNNEDKKFRPYLFAGPGILADNGESGLNFNIGAGDKYYVSPATALYMEVGYVNGIESTVAGKKTRDNFWKATVGVEFDFGKTPDSDMDGVSDNKDKCPNTPAGVAVDANGCPIDTDGDGVADYIDDCPTVAGLTSLKGCPDSDKDGVADKDDACPDVAGLVSLKGCPDTDGDGVADKDDKCPDTPKGAKVDAKGCPVDSDGDGVPDYLDKCPTVPGVKDNNGCPKEKTAEEIEAEKMKVEPVYFDSNKATFSAQEKAKVDKLVTLLQENSNYNVKVTGYADALGADAYNLNLSKNRVSAVVKSILSSKNKLKKNRIELQKGLGEANPAATNDTPEGRALNRRVEFEVTKK
ncbi:OmpA domain protein [Aquipluma nitroreducens]|uniref:OmpA domain protein n=1 Tax=Aquipluma nitroreducens TaxID=2010828 RepID=A0A5K7S5H7_9BACT|nr:OmpA family protein [Aquipluma nitroreducens]BBE16793.1 OmpA domain protein [Aquipluma nitroreducens]